MLTFQSAGGTGSKSSSAVRAAAASQKQTAAAKSNEGSMSSSAAQAADAPAQKQTAAAKSKTGRTTKASNRIMQQRPCYLASCCISIYCFGVSLLFHCLFRSFFIQLCRANIHTGK